MIGPGTYIFPNGTQQHGEYIVVEEEVEDDSDTGKGKDGEAENWSRTTKQVKIKWVSRSGDAQPVTIVKKETMINWLALHAQDNQPTRTFLRIQNLGANWIHDSRKRYAARCSCEDRINRWQALQTQRNQFASTFTLAKKHRRILKWMDDSQTPNGIQHCSEKRDLHIDTNIYVSAHFFKGTIRGFYESRLLAVYRRISCLLPPSIQFVFLRFLEIN